MQERRRGSLSSNLIRAGAFGILLVLGIFAGRLVVEGRPNVVLVKPVEEQTFTGSFSDIFSGTAWIDEEKTTMYRDNAVGAFFFPPDFVWKSAGDARVIEELKNETPAGELERTCLGKKCLVMHETKLFLEEENKSIPVLYPGSSDKKTIRVAISALSSKWLVGVTQSEGGNFSVRIYRYNGSEFEDIYSDGRVAFTSPKEGFLGLGGTDNEWIAFWSGYEGQALRVRFGGEPENISGFFGIRLMQGGFLPLVTRVASRESVDWYVWGVGEGNPRMIKMFEALDGEIGGVIDFTPFLFDEAATKITPRFEGTGTLSYPFIVRVDEKNGSTKWMRFEDKGFRFGRTELVTSKNIKTTGRFTRAASISPIRLFLGGGRAQFEVSADGIGWMPVVLGKEALLNTFQTGLYWRAQFELGENRRLTPFFRGIHVDYREAL